MTGPAIPEDIAIAPGRPLVIIDADEVLLRFLTGLERYLPSQGLYLDLTGYALTGSIKHADTRIPAEQKAVSEVIKTFHATAGLDLEAVAGATDALRRLAEHAQIVVLTNIGPEIAAARRANLAAQGIDVPVISNTGLKGPMVAALAAAADGAPVFFVDDIPHHHASVAELSPGAHQIHFVADERLFAMAKPSPHARLFTRDWSAAADHILEALDRHKS